MKTRTLSVILSVFIFSQCWSTQFCARLKNISAGENHTLALDAYGNLWACGYGPLGIGNNVYESALYLKRVRGLDGNGFLGHIISFDAGLEHSLAVIESNGVCLAWGVDDWGKLGNGPNEGDSNVPIKVHGLNNDPNGLRNIVKVSAGRSGYHSLAVDSNGYVYAWGLNSSGQCGIGIKIPPYDILQYPYQVIGETGTGLLGGSGNKIVDVDAGVFHSLALVKREDGGYVYEWGNNSSVPHKVPRSGGNGYLRNIVDIATCYISLAADANGDVWYWTRSGNPPVKVPRFAYIVKVAVGEHSDEDHGYCAALDSNGIAWQWTSGGTPARVPGGQMHTQSGFLEDIVALDVGFYDHQVAIDRFGRGWGWNTNTYGQLGIGNTNSQTEPVQMLCPQISSPMVLTKTDDVNCASHNDTINYEISYNANGFADTNVIIIDELLTEVNFVSASGGIDTNYNESSRTVTWYLGTLESDASGDVNLTVSVNPQAAQACYIKNTCEMLGDQFITGAAEKTYICGKHPVVYVDINKPADGNGSSWTNSFKELRNALPAVEESNCPCAEQIWVARGTYKPTNDANQTDANFLMLDGINMYGHFEGWEDSIDQRNLADTDNERN